VTSEKQNIGALFDRIATSYDFLNHILSLNIDKIWRRRAVKSLKPVDSLLDVAIGTADLSIEIIKQGKAERIKGLDLSEQMMKIGEEKVRKRVLSSKIFFDKGSALDMPYKAESFDAVTCAFGVRNFSDIDKGLSEFNRVLKKGGEVVILEFSYPSNKFIAAIYDLYFSNILPFVGKLFSKDKKAYSYLNSSVKNFIWGSEMVKKITGHGFSEVTCTTLSFGIASIYKAIKE